MYWSRMYLSLSNSVNVAQLFHRFHFCQDKLISPSYDSPRENCSRRFDTRMNERTNEGEICFRLATTPKSTSLVRVWLWNVLYETILSLSRPSFIIIIIEAIRRSKRRLSGHREKGLARLLPTVVSHNVA